MQQKMSLLEFDRLYTTHSVLNPALGRSHFILIFVPLATSTKVDSYFLS